MQASTREEIAVMEPPHFGAELDFCPVCGSRVYERICGDFAASPETACPRCGAPAEPDAAELAKQALPWSHLVDTSLVESFWQDDSSFCPNDSTPLRAFRSPRTPGRSVCLVLQCPKCGRELAA